MPGGDLAAGLDLAGSVRPHNHFAASLAMLILFLTLSHSFATVRTDAAN
jgi:hypothetical protein